MVEKNKLLQGYTPYYFKFDLAATLHTTHMTYRMWNDMVALVRLNNLHVVNIIKIYLANVYATV